MHPSEQYTTSHDDGYGRKRKMKNGRLSISAPVAPGETNCACQIKGQTHNYKSEWDPDHGAGIMHILAKQAPEDKKQDQRFDKGTIRNVGLRFSDRNN